MGKPKGPEATRQLVSGLVNRSDGSPVPGVLVVFHGGAPMLRAVPIPDDGLILGRELFGAHCADEHLSPRHAWVIREGGRFTISELDRRNATYVNGQALRGEREQLPPPVVIRAGGTVCIALPDIRRFAGRQVLEHDSGDGPVIVGPTLATTWAAVETAAARGNALLLTGEAGTGKELAARAFHRAARRFEASRARGRFVTITCRDVTAGVADRLLFGYGTREGLLASADGGTVFFDEIGDLRPPIQAQLLHALEHSELQPVGIDQPKQKIDLHVVAATSRYLPFELGDKRMDRGLYEYLSRNHVEMPPLRERFDDLAYLVTAEVHRVAPSLKIRASLIESCLLGDWTSNLRELLGAVRAVAQGAHERGEPAVRGGLSTMGSRAKHLVFLPPMPSPAQLYFERMRRMENDPQASPYEDEQRELDDAPPDDGLN